MAKFRHDHKFILPAILATTFLLPAGPLQARSLNGSQSSAGAASGRSIKSIRLKYGKSSLLVRVYGNNWKINRGDLISWVDDAARSVILYYGSLPLKRTVISVTQTADRGVGFATASYSDRFEEGRIKVNLGRYTRARDLKDTWTLTHEMVHLTFPLVNDRYNWLTEGIATYVEPIGRYRAGLISREKLWGDLVDGLPQGQPQIGDRGLNHTHTWGRTYWGGAIYCLLADLELRKETKNRYGLEHALRGIMYAGANAGSELLNAREILKLADKHTKTSVMTRIYDQQKNRPVTINLHRIWRQLGVKKTGGRVVFNNNAPMAHIRKAIESGTGR